MILSGGSALSEHLSKFFKGVGFEILEGYGLTEAGVTCINPPGRGKIGTVGPPIPGTRLAVDEHGEVLIKSRQRLTEYYGNPEATQASFVDDWYYTGDLGRFEDGYLRIVGRSKEVIVTASGKNVAPTVLEEGLTQHPLIGQAMAVGNDRP